ncbi:MAG: hypothetical protein ACO3NL_03835 [Phycisphaerales bacterium]
MKFSVDGEPPELAEVAGGGTPRPGGPLHWEAKASEGLSAGAGDTTRSRRTASPSSPADRRRRLASLVEAIAAVEGGETLDRIASREQAREAMARRLESPDAIDGWPEAVADMQGAVRISAIASIEPSVAEPAGDPAFDSSTMARASAGSSTSVGLRLRTGWPSIDRALGGGLPLGALHEWMLDREQCEGSEASAARVGKSGGPCTLEACAGEEADVAGSAAIHWSKEESPRTSSQAARSRWSRRRSTFEPPLGAIIQLLWRMLDQAGGIASGLPAAPRVLWIGRGAFPHPRSLLREGARPWSVGEFAALLEAPRQRRVRLEEPCDRRLLEASWCVDSGAADPSLEARAWAIEQAVRCRGVAAVVADGRGFRMPITRRLHLAAKSAEAEGHPTLLLLLREPEEMHAISAASTRWKVSPRRISGTTSEGEVPIGAGTAPRIDSRSAGDADLGWSVVLTRRRGLGAAATCAVSEFAVASEAVAFDPHPNAWVSGASASRPLVPDVLVSGHAVAATRRDAPEGFAAVESHVETVTEIAARDARPRVALPRAGPSEASRLRTVARSPGASRPPPCEAKVSANFHPVAEPSSRDGACHDDRLHVRFDHATRSSATPRARAASESGTRTSLPRGDAAMVADGSCTPTVASGARPTESEPGSRRTGAGIEFAERCVDLAADDGLRIRSEACLPNRHHAHAWPGDRAVARCGVGSDPPVGRYDGGGGHGVAASRGARVQGAADSSPVSRSGSAIASRGERRAVAAGAARRGGRGSDADLPSLFDGLPAGRASGP